MVAKKKKKLGLRLQKLKIIEKHKLLPDDASNCLREGAEIKLRKKQSYKYGTINIHAND